MHQFKNHGKSRIQELKGAALDRFLMRKQGITWATAEILRMLQIFQGEMSRKQIMTALSLHDEKNFRQRYQKVALELSLIEMTMLDKPKSPKQRYRLTAKAKQLKN